MKTKIIVSLIIVLAISGFIVYGYFNATPGQGNGQDKYSKIEITPQSYDFGEVSYGNTVEHTFKIKNSGEEPLEIKRVATSCGCTTAKVGQDIIGPGEESDLRVVYDTDAMTGSHAQGRQERIIYVKSNDPLNPQVEVMIYAFVK